MVKRKFVEQFFDTASENNPRYFSKNRTRTIRSRDMDLFTKPVRESAKIVKQTGRVTKNVTSFVKLTWERCLTVAVYIFALLILAFMIIEETKNYREKPTGTSVTNDMYPVQEINFPAVAICDINILSRRRVVNLAGELWNHRSVQQIDNMTRERVIDLLKYMGHLYTFTSWETEPGDIKLLDKIFKISFGQNYNVARIMEEIIPLCRKYFEHCSWEGEIRSCEEMFIPRWTQDGNCCTFNYVRWNEGFSGEANKAGIPFHIERSKTAGIEYGLQVFLNPYYDDVYYNILSARGLKVLIYTASDYPDAPSGGLREILIGPGFDNWIKVKTNVFYSSPDVIKYDKDKRRCLFSSELSEDFNGSYSYSQCMMLCRIRDILKNCDCIPFFYPYPKEFETSRDCTITDLACLRKFRHKWWSIKPTLNKLNDAWEEIEKNQESLECDCLPSCENVNYGVATDTAMIHHYDIGLIDFVRNYNKVKVINNSILLHINFEGPTTIRLRQDVLYYWYDLLSTYGGLCSLFISLSILTPIEFIYLSSVRLLAKNRKKSNKLSGVDDRSPVIVVSSKLDEQPIYWREMVLSKQGY